MSGTTGVAIPDKYSHRSRSSQALSHNQKILRGPGAQSRHRSFPWMHDTATGAPVELLNAATLPHCRSPKTRSVRAQLSIPG
jgi:hypothetical protein